MRTTGIPSSELRLVTRDGGQRLEQGFVSALPLRPCSTVTTDPRHVGFCENTCIRHFGRRGNPTCFSAHASGAQTSSAAGFQGIVILVFEWPTKLHH